MHVTTATPAALPLRVNLAWTMIGNLVQAGAQWGVVVVLARLGDAHIVGAYALALAIVSPVFLFFNMHLRSLLATDVALSTGIGTYFSLRLTASATAALVLVAAAGFRGGEQGLVLAGLALAKAFEAISDLLYGELQRNEQMDRIGKSMVARWAGTLVIVAAAMSWTQSLPAAVFAMALLSAGVAASDVLHTQAYRMRSTPLEIRRLAASAAPLGLLLLLVSLNAAIPRYFLAAMDSHRAVGVFAALSYLSIALNTLVMAAGQAGGPAIARSFWSRNAPRFLRQSAKLMALSVALGIAAIGGAWWKGDLFLLVLYGPPYASEYPSFLWLMVAGAASYLASAMGYVLASARCFHPQLPTLGITALVTALGCRLWIPQLGVTGAAMAQLAGYAAQLGLSLLLLGYICWRRFR